MFDFAVPTSRRGSVEARNMKGMMTFDRKTKKDSYFWYKANWSKDPVVYLTQRRNDKRERRETSVTVYSNVGTPHVTLNGRDLGTPRRGNTDVHYIFDNVRLDDGKNVLLATAGADGKQYTDTITWNYNGDCDRAADFKEYKKEHGSW